MYDVRTEGWRMEQGLDLMEPAADIGVGHFRLDNTMFQWYCDLVLVTLVMLETLPQFPHGLKHGAIDTQFARCQKIKTFLQLVARRLRLSSSSLPED